MNEKKRNFDQAAKTWDSNERRQRLADGVFCAIMIMFQLIKI